MPTFRIYNVVDKTTGKIVKIGSTEKTLENRKKCIPYRNPKYKNCELTLLREFTHDDEKFGLILLRVREQFEISRKHLWFDEDGWNISRPVQTLLNGYDTKDIQKQNGLIAAKKLMESKRGIFGLSSEERKRIQIKGGHAAGILAAKHNKVPKVPLTTSIRNGFIQGRKNVENGHLRKVCTRAVQSNGGKIGTHIRWHINRNIKKPTCLFCS